MTAASKLEGIKPGDRVRVTFEGVFGSMEREPWMSDDPFSIVFDGGESRWFPKRMANAPTFQIERIEPPLAVGDRVRFGGFHGAIKGIDGTRAWVSYDDGSYGSPFMPDLKRIP